MLDVYVPNGSSLERRTVVSGDDVPDNAVWFDLINPAPGEDKLIEGRLGIAVPTREEMQEIEVSSRLYTEHHARFMTATLMCNSDTVVPRTTAVTFILAKHCLVTVRYDDPKPFMLISNKLTRNCPQSTNGEAVLMELLDAVVDREADLLERIGIDIDQVSHDIFDPHGRGPEQGNSYISTLKVIGVNVKRDDEGNPIAGSEEPNRRWSTSASRLILRTQSHSLWSMTRRSPWCRWREARTSSMSTRTRPKSRW